MRFVQSGVCVWPPGLWVCSLVTVLYVWTPHSVKHLLAFLVPDSRDIQ